MTLSQEKVWSRALAAAFGSASRGSCSGDPDERAEARRRAVLSLLPPESGSGGAGRDERRVAGQALDARGRYVLLERLGSGGMGRVDRAFDHDLGREVAIKRLHAEHADRSVRLRAFLSEARLGARLQHPGIVPVHDVGLDREDRPFLVMSLIEGHDLAWHLAQRTDRNDRRRRWIEALGDAAETLGHAHARGVVHRDVKPANIVLADEGGVLVADWGLAVETDAARAEGVGRSSGAVGSAAWMAPEQAEPAGERPSPSGDVFALGAILYEILVGCSPWVAVVEASGGTVSTDSLLKAIRERTLEAAFRRLREHCEDPLLVKLCEEALSLEATERPPSAAAFADSLQVWGEELERQAADSRRALASAESSLRRSRLRLRGGMLAAVAVLVCGFVVSEVLRRSSLDESRRESRFERGLDAAQSSLFVGDPSAARAHLEPFFGVPEPPRALAERLKQLREELRWQEARAAFVADGLRWRSAAVSDDDAVLERAREALLGQPIKTWWRGLNTPDQPGAPRALGPALADVVAVVDHLALRALRSRAISAEETSADASEPSDPASEDPVAALAFWLKEGERIDPSGDAPRAAWRAALHAGEPARCRRVARALAEAATGAHDPWLGASTLSIFGREDEALRVAEGAFAAFPSDPWINRFLARSFANRSGESAASARHARFAQALGPGRGMPVEVELALARGELGAAAEHLAAHLERNPRDGLAHWRLVAIRREQGQSGEAQRLVDQAVELGLREPTRRARGPDHRRRGAPGRRPSDPGRRGSEGPPRGRRAEEARGPASRRLDLARLLSEDAIEAQLQTVSPSSEGRPPREAWLAVESLAALGAYEAGLELSERLGWEGARPHQKRLAFELALDAGQLSKARAVLALVRSRSDGASLGRRLRGAERIARGATITPRREGLRWALAFGRAGEAALLLTEAEIERRTPQDLAFLQSLRVLARTFAEGEKGAGDESLREELARLLALGLQRGASIPGAQPVWPWGRDRILREALGRPGAPSPALQAFPELRKAWAALE